MTDPKKETIWITIPDEATPASTDGPALKAAVEAYGRAPADKVRNKGFWAVGFVVLVAALFLLLAPQQFASLLKGDLFDGSFQVIPDYQEQQGGALFGDDEAEEGEAGAEEVKDENVVEAEAEAVSIQVEPVTEVGETEGATDSSTGDETGIHAAAPEGDTAAENAGTAAASDTAATSGTTATTSAGTEGAGSDAEAITIDTETGEIVALPDDTGTVTAQGGATTDADLLQTLSKQLNDYKEKERQNEQMIQQLMQMLEDQASGTNIPPGTETAAQFGAGAGTGTAAGTYDRPTGLSAGAQGVYRYNTHTVTVSPYDILAQNKAITTQPASYQANVTYGAQAYSQQTYNPVLAGVQGQPDTGPAETILFAFALASLGVLVWGASRAMKA